MERIVWLLRRVGRMLFVLNPAACWLLLRTGPSVAAGYLQELWRLYLWPQSLPQRALAPLLLPETAPEELFSGLDLTHLDLLHPMPGPGGVRIEELVLLGAIARHLRPSRVIEIGTAAGRTTLNLAHHLADDAEVITLDLPPEGPAKSNEFGGDYRQMGFAEAGVLFGGHPLAARIKRLLADSTELDWRPYESSAGLVFIDGGHDLPTVRSDTQNALRSLLPGGVILWHDFGVSEGVTHCLAELRKTHPVVWVKGTTLACLRTDP